MINKTKLIDILLEKFYNLRYVAIYTDNVLVFKQRESIENTSSSESDKYEELIVNPTLLTLTRQRGNIDCGGLDYILIGYCNFIQIIKEIKGGHISLCLDKNADLTKEMVKIMDFL
ncbi:MAG: hypothetical protein ACM3RX_02275, partial [Methanococcaceae archaeon]